MTRERDKKLIEIIENVTYLMKEDWPEKTQYLFTKCIISDVKNYFNLATGRTFANADKNADVLYYRLDDEEEDENGED